MAKPAVSSSSSQSRHILIDQIRSQLEQAASDATSGTSLCVDDLIMLDPSMQPILSEFSNENPVSNAWSSPLGPAAFALGQCSSSPYESLSIVSVESLESDGRFAPFNEVCFGRNTTPAPAARAPPRAGATVAVTFRGLGDAAAAVKTGLERLETAALAAARQAVLDRVDLATRAQASVGLLDPTPGEQAEITQACNDAVAHAVSEKLGVDIRVNIHSRVRLLTEVVADGPEVFFLSPRAVIAGDQVMAALGMGLRDDTGIAVVFKHLATSSPVVRVRVSVFVDRVALWHHERRVLLVNSDGTNAKSITSLLEKMDNTLVVAAEANFSDFTDDLYPAFWPVSCTQSGAKLDPGMMAPEGGRLTIGDTDVAAINTLEGIGMTFSPLRLFDSLHGDAAVAEADEAYNTLKSRTGVDHPHLLPSQDMPSILAPAGINVFLLPNKSESMHAGYDHVSTVPKLRALQSRKGQSNILLGPDFELGNAPHANVLKNVIYVAGLDLTSSDVLAGLAPFDNVSLAAIHQPLDLPHFSTVSAQTFSAEFTVNIDDIRDNINAAAEAASNKQQGRLSHDRSFCVIVSLVTAAGYSVPSYLDYAGTAPTFNTESRTAHVIYVDENAIKPTAKPQSAAATATTHSEVAVSASSEGKHSRRDSVFAMNSRRSSVLSRSSVSATGPGTEPGLSLTMPALPEHDETFDADHHAPASASAPAPKPSMVTFGLRPTDAAMQHLQMMNLGLSMPHLLITVASVESFTAPNSPKFEIDNSAASVLANASSDVSRVVSTEITNSPYIRYSWCSADALLRRDTHTQFTTNVQRDERAPPTIAGETAVAAAKAVTNVMPSGYQTIQWGVMPLLARPGVIRADGAAEARAFFTERIVGRVHPRNAVGQISLPADDDFTYNGASINELVTWPAWLRPHALTRMVSSFTIPISNVYVECPTMLKESPLAKLLVPDLAANPEELLTHRLDAILALRPFLARALGTPRTLGLIDTASVTPEAASMVAANLPLDLVCSVIRSWPAMLLAASSLFRDACPSDRPRVLEVVGLLLAVFLPIGLDAVRFDLAAFGTRALEQNTAIIVGARTHLLAGVAALSSQLGIALINAAAEAAVKGHYVAPSSMPLSPTISALTAPTSFPSLAAVFSAWPAAAASIMTITPFLDSAHAAAHAVQALGAVLDEAARAVQDHSTVAGHVTSATLMVAILQAASTFTLDAVISRANIKQIKSAIEAAIKALSGIIFGALRTGATPGAVVGSLLVPGSPRAHRMQLGFTPELFMAVARTTSAELAFMPLPSALIFNDARAEAAKLATGTLWLSLVLDPLSAAQVNTLHTGARFWITYAKAVKARNDRLAAVTRDILAVAGLLAHSCNFTLPTEAIVAPTVSAFGPAFARVFYPISLSPATRIADRDLFVVYSLRQIAQTVTSPLYADGGASERATILARAGRLLAAIGASTSTNSSLTSDIIELLLMIAVTSHNLASMPDPITMNTTDNIAAQFKINFETFKNTSNATQIALGAALTIMKTQPKPDRWNCSRIVQQCLAAAAALCRSKLPTPVATPDLATVVQIMALALLASVSQTIPSTLASHILPNTTVPAPALASVPDLSGPFACQAPQLIAGTHKRWRVLPVGIKQACVSFGMLPLFTAAPPPPVPGAAVQSLTRDDVVMTASLLVPDSQTIKSVAESARKWSVIGTSSVFDDSVATAGAAMAACTTIAAMREMREIITQTAQNVGSIVIPPLIHTTLFTSSQGSSDINSVIEDLVTHGFIADEATGVTGLINALAEDAAVGSLQLASSIMNAATATNCSAAKVAAKRVYGTCKEIAALLPTNINNCTSSIRQNPGPATAALANIIVERMTDRNTLINYAIALRSVRETSDTLAPGARRRRDSRADIADVNTSLIESGVEMLQTSCRTLLVLAPICGAVASAAGGASRFDSMLAAASVLAEAQDPRAHTYIDAAVRYQSHIPAALPPLLAAKGMALVNGTPDLSVTARLLKMDGFEIDQLAASLGILPGSNVRSQIFADSVNLPSTCVASPTLSLAGALMAAPANGGIETFNSQTLSEPTITAQKVAVNTVNHETISFMTLGTAKLALMRASGAARRVGDLEAAACYAKMAVSVNMDAARHIVPSALHALAVTPFDTVSGDATMLVETLTRAQPVLNICTHWLVDFCGRGHPAAVRGQKFVVKVLPQCSVRGTLSATIAGLSPGAERAILWPPEPAPGVLNDLCVAVTPAYSAQDASNVAVDDFTNAASLIPRAERPDLGLMGKAELAALEDVQKPVPVTPVAVDAVKQLQKLAAASAKPAHSETAFDQVTTREFICWPTSLSSAAGSITELWSERDAAHRAYVIKQRFAASDEVIEPPMQPVKRISVFAADLPAGQPSPALLIVATHDQPEYAMTACLSAQKANVARIADLLTKSGQRAVPSAAAAKQSRSSRLAAAASVDKRSEPAVSGACGAPTLGINEPIIIARNDSLQQADMAFVLPALIRSTFSGAYESRTVGLRSALRALSYNSKRIKSTGNYLHLLAKRVFLATQREAKKEGRSFTLKLADRADIARIYLPAEAPEWRISRMLLKSVSEEINQLVEGKTISLTTIADKAEDPALTSKFAEEVARAGASVHEVHAEELI